ncbi:hypothetical protein PCE1_003557 [Barthelona sp. PCE]
MSTIRRALVLLEDSNPNRRYRGLKMLAKENSLVFEDLVDLRDNFVLFPLFRDVLDCNRELSLQITTTVFKKSDMGLASLEAKDFILALCEMMISKAGTGKCEEESEHVRLACLELLQFFIVTLTAGCLAFIEMICQSMASMLYDNTPKILQTACKICVTMADSEELATLYQQHCLILLRPLFINVLSHRRQKVREAGLRALKKPVYHHSNCFETEEYVKIIIRFIIKNQTHPMILTEMAIVGLHWAGLNKERVEMQHCSQFSEIVFMLFMSGLGSPCQDTCEQVFNMLNDMGPIYEQWKRDTKQLNQIGDALNFGSTSMFYTARDLSDDEVVERIEHLNKVCPHILLSRFFDMHPCTRLFVIDRYVKLLKFVSMGLTSWTSSDTPFYCNILQSLLLFGGREVVGHLHNLVPALIDVNTEDSRLVEKVWSLLAALVPLDSLLNTLFIAKPHEHLDIVKSKLDALGHILVGLKESDITQKACDIIDEFADKMEFFTFTDADFHRSLHKFISVVSRQPYECFKDDVTMHRYVFAYCHLQKEIYTDSSDIELNNWPSQAEIICNQFETLFLKVLGEENYTALYWLFCLVFDDEDRVTLDDETKRMIWNKFITVLIGAKTEKTYNVHTLIGILKISAQFIGHLVPFSSEVLQFLVECSVWKAGPDEFLVRFYALKTLRGLLEQTSFVDDFDVEVLVGNCLVSAEVEPAVYGESKKNPRWIPILEHTDELRATSMYILNKIFICGHHMSDKQLVNICQAALVSFGDPYNEVRLHAASVFNHAYLIYQQLIDPPKSELEWQYHKDFEDETAKQFNRYHKPIQPPLLSKTDKIAEWTELHIDDAKSDNCTLLVERLRSVLQIVN